MRYDTFLSWGLLLVRCLSVVVDFFSMLKFGVYSHFSMGMVIRCVLSDSCE